MKKILKITAIVLITIILWSTFVMTMFAKWDLDRTHSDKNVFVHAYDVTVSMFKFQKQFKQYQESLDEPILYRDFNEEPCELTGDGME